MMRPKTKTIKLVHSFSHATMELPTPELTHASLQSTSLCNSADIQAVGSLGHRDVPKVEIRNPEGG